MGREHKQRRPHKRSARAETPDNGWSTNSRTDLTQWQAHQQNRQENQVHKKRSACQKQGQSLGHAHTGERRARSRCRNSEADTQTQGGSVARYASRFGLRESTSAAAVVENENNPTPKRGVALEHDQAHEHERRHKQGRRQASRQQMVHGHEGRS